MTKVSPDDDSDVVKITGSKGHSGKGKNMQELIMRGQKMINVASNSVKVGSNGKIIND